MLECMPQLVRLVACSVSRLPLQVSSKLRIFQDVLFLHCFLRWLPLNLVLQLSPRNLHQAAKFASGQKENKTYAHTISHLPLFSVYKKKVAHLILSLR
jgi:hypothetical protein